MQKFFQLLACHLFSMPILVPSATGAPYPSAPRPHISLSLSLTLSLCRPHLRSPAHLSTGWSSPPRPRVHPARRPEATTPSLSEGLPARCPEVAHGLPRPPLSALALCPPLCQARSPHASSHHRPPPVRQTTGPTFAAVSDLLQGFFDWSLCISPLVLVSCEILVCLQWWGNKICVGFISGWLV
jgi:hypothetical protein